MKRKVKQGVARMTQSGPHEVTAGNHRVAAETDLAAEVKRLLASDRPDEAAERFGAIIDRQQRRAARIAYHYLRDPAEVDEVVQDAFLKAFLHLPSFRDDLYFELWFTRILVNACLDRLKAKARRARWLVPSDARDNAVADGLPSREPSPEAALLAKERRAHLEAAIDQLPTRQRTAVILRHLEGSTAREVSTVMGLTESTVRVHLFRAVRKLQSLLDKDGWSSRGRTAPNRISQPGAQSEYVR